MNENEIKNSPNTDMEILADTAPKASAGTGVQGIPELSFENIRDNESWLGSVASGLLKIFIEQPDIRQKYETFEQREAAKLACRNRFDSFKKLVEINEERLVSLREQVAPYATLDVAEGIFEAHGRNISPYLIAITTDPQVIGQMLIKEHGPQIVELQKQKLATLEKEFSDWQAANRDILRELKLI